MSRASPRSRFFDAILFEPRGFGFVNSRMGKNGGYAISRQTQAITIGEILRVIRGPLALDHAALERNLSNAA